jgi:phosphate:Na+ symporter
VNLVRLPRDILTCAALCCAVLVSAPSESAAVALPSCNSQDALVDADGLVLAVHGSRQEGRTGTWLSEPLAVTVCDSAGRPVEGAAVEFWVEDGTDAELSTANDLKLGSEMRRYVVNAFIRRPPVGSGIVCFTAQAYDAKRIVFWIIGGLGLFLYGISLMSTSLQKVAGPKLKNVLKLLTSNRFVAVGMGAFVTAIIQSSSATTVMVVGFVNAGLLRLQQAIGVVIGANVGTTITGQLIAFKIDRAALPIIGIGFVFIMLSRRKQTRLWGEAMLGFGLLFLGLSIMKQVLAPLGGSNLFQGFFIRFSEQPILGVLAGMLATMIIQSSSATVGLTMALAAAGLIDLQGAICLVLGENVGTTVTAQLASIGSGRAAKRAALAHTMFNLIGVTVMVFIMYTTPAYVNLVRATSGDIMRQVANSHTLFNVMNAIVFLPLIGLLRATVERIIPGAATEVMAEPKYLERHLLETPLVALEQAKKEIARMAEAARRTVCVSTRAFFDGDSASFREVHALEDGIDNLQREITHYLVELAERNLTEVESEQLPVLLHTVNDLERIGDHAENIVELAERRRLERVDLPQEALDQLRAMAGDVDSMAGHVIKAFAEDDTDEARRALKIEARLNRLHIELRQGYAMRLGKGDVGALSGLVFFDMVMNLEKMGDHYTNIAQAVLGELQWDKGIKARQT